MWGDEDDPDSGHIHLLGRDADSPIVCSKHMTVNITKYLLKISEANVPDETKLAALSLLNQMFEQDSHQIVRFAAIEENVLPILLSLMDNFILPAEKCDSGAGSDCPTLSLMLCQLAFKLFWHLSQLPICQQQALITVPIIRRLVSFLDPSESKIYHFSSAMCKTFRMYIQGKTLFGQVKKQALTAELLARIKAQTGRHSSKTFPHRLISANTVYSCILYDTSDPNRDVNIAEALIEEELAWPDLSGTSGGESDSSEERMEETEVHVLQAIRGQLFWAYVGEVSVYVKTMQDLHNKMISQSESLSHVTCPAIGDYVMVKQQTEGSAPASFFYRGYISGLKGDNFDVFAIDLGIVLSSVSGSSLCHLPPGVGIQDQTPLASLCLLHGVTPPVRLPLLPQLAAASLVNLCRYSVPAGEIFAKTLSGLPVLYVLLRCPDRRIAIQALQLLNNLASKTTVQEHLDPAHLIPLLIEMLMTRKPAGEVDEVGEDHTEACLIALSTLMTLGQRYREVFYHRDGLPVVLRLLSASPNQNLYNLLVKLLRIFLWNVPLNSYGTKKDRMGRMLGDRGWESEGEGRRSLGRTNTRRPRSHSLSRSDGDRPSRRSRSTEVTARFHEGRPSEHRRRGVHKASESDYEMSDLIRNTQGQSNRQHRKSASPTLYKASSSAAPVYRGRSVRSVRDLAEPDDSQVAIIMSLGTTLEQARLALQAAGNDVDKASEWVLDNVEWLTLQAEGGIEVDQSTASTVEQQPPTVPVDATSDYIGLERYYVVDSFVDFDQDEHNELRPNMSITHASTENISKIVCGFLNSGVAGRIVFGVRPDGRVHGVSINREERDQFRLGVDRLMVDKLRPVIRHSLFDIVYCPVVRPVGHSDPHTRSPLRDIYVVEILLKADPGSLRTLTNGQCYYRFQADTVRLNSQQVRQMTILEEEAECKAEIRNLQKELSTLRQIIRAKTP